MIKLQQKHFLIALGVLFFLSIFANRFIRSSLQFAATDKKQDRKGKGVPKEVFIEENSKYHPVPDDPADFNIPLQDQGVPLTEQQWEYRMREGVRSARGSAQSPERSLTGVVRKPAEIDKKIAEIKTQIKEYEAAALNNPNDQAAQEKLQTLYMIKATLTVLKDRVTNSN